MSEATSSSGKVIWILIALVTVQIAVAGAGLYLQLSERAQVSAQQQAVVQAEIEAARPVVPILVEFGPLTVNLKNDNLGQRLLYSKLLLRVGNEETRDFLNEYRPSVHNRLLLLLSGRSADDLTSPIGKRQLANEILAMFEQPLVENQPELQVRDVLFQEFIVQ